MSSYLTAAVETIVYFNQVNISLCTRMVIEIYIIFVREKKYSFSLFSQKCEHLLWGTIHRLILWYIFENQTDESNDYRILMLYHSFKDLVQIKKLLKTW